MRYRARKLVRLSNGSQARLHPIREAHRRSEEDQQSRPVALIAAAASEVETVGQALQAGLDSAVAGSVHGLEQQAEEQRAQLILGLGLATHAGEIGARDGTELQHAGGVRHHAEGVDVGGAGTRAEVVGKKAVGECPDVVQRIGVEHRRDRRNSRRLHEPLPPGVVALDEEGCGQHGLCQALQKLDGELDGRAPRRPVELRQCLGHVVLCTLRVAHDPCGSARCCFHVASRVAMLLSTPPAVRSYSSACCMNWIASRFASSCRARRAASSR